MPSDFLAAWARHLKLRKEILNLANIPIITDVKADLKVEGKVRVVTLGGSGSIGDINPSSAMKESAGKFSGGGGAFDSPDKN
jgi:hypothetical protein